MPWLIVRNTDNNALVMGCGSAEVPLPHHSHRGRHLGVDTVNISRTVPNFHHINIDPDIIADVTNPVGTPLLFKKYKYILIENINNDVFNEPMLYENIDYLRTSDAIVIVLPFEISIYSRIINSYSSHKNYQIRISKYFSDIPDVFLKDSRYKRSILAQIHVLHVRFIILNFY